MLEGLRFSRRFFEKKNSAKIFPPELILANFVGLARSLPFLYADEENSVFLQNRPPGEENIEISLCERSKEKQCKTVM
jgi:hypothetical protein